MALEKAWLAVTATPFTANGTAFGLVTVADTTGFKVKGYAYIAANTLSVIQVQVQVVLSPTQLIVGPMGSTPARNNFTDISAYTTALGATIGFPDQPKNKIKPDDIEQATYEADPTVAIRTVLVDQYGNFYGGSNPIPIIFDGTLQVGDVSIVEGGHTMKVNPDGSINVVVESIPASNTLVISKFNEIAAVASGATVQLVSYTVPASKQAVLQRCPVSGDNIGKYDLLINNVIQDTTRTMFGGDLSQMFDFTSGNDSGLVLNAGDVIKIQVYNPRPYAANFNARIQVLEITI